MKTIVFLIALFFSVGAGFADEQVRLLGHWRSPNVSGRAAAWIGVPDVLAGNPAGYAEVGWLRPLQSQGKPAGWFEVLAGGFRDGAARVEPLFDVRFYRTFRNERVDVFVEAFYKPKSGTVAVPPAIFTVRAGPMRLGAELDVVFADGKKPEYHGGPRLSFSPAKFREKPVVLAWSWHFRDVSSGGNFLRMYMVVNF